MFPILDPDTLDRISRPTMSVVLLFRPAVPVPLFVHTATSCQVDHLADCSPGPITQIVLLFRPDGCGPVVGLIGHSDHHYDLGMPQGQQMLAPDSARTRTEIALDALHIHWLSAWVVAKRRNGAEQWSA